MNKDFQGPLYCLKKPVHSPAEKNAGWAIYGEGKGTQQTKRERPACMAWAAGGWCNDTQCLQSLEILRIILDQNKFSLQEFLKLFVQTKNSQYQADFIVCAVCPSDVDMTPWQPIRGILVTNEGAGTVCSMLTQEAEDIHQDDGEGRCGYFLVVAGCR